MAEVSAEQARAVALAVVAALRGEGDLRRALSDCNDAARSIAPLDPSGPPSPGLPADFVVPSVWHAACALLLQWWRTKLDARPFAASRELAETFFGKRSLFRGQAHPWPIAPSLWRPVHDRSRRLGSAPITAFSDFLRQWSTQANDLPFDMYGRLDSHASAAATAQHYGFPTNLVDFTFDPLVALHFAAKPAGPLDAPIAGSPPGHAVVYTTSFVKLWTAGGHAKTPAMFHFPPVQVRRLYDQTGFFVDFGTRADEPAAAEPHDFESPWRWIEQNCIRIFFPRAYPGDEGIECLLGRSVEDPEAFFEQPLARLSNYISESERFSPEEAVRRMVLGTSVRPPWMMQDDREALFYVDTQFLAVARRLESYLKVAALVQMGSGFHFDPALILRFLDAHPEPFRAVLEIAAVPGECRDALERTAILLREALVAANELRELGPAT